ncbi:MAG: Tfp pilus assembly protein FimT/FimU [Leptonema sp. (in: bacteria)]
MDSFGIKRRGLTIIEMAIVLLILSILMGIIFSLVRNFSIFKTTQGETETLKDMYSFAKRSAIKSGQILFMEFDLNENKYRLYRKERTASEIKNKILVEKNLFYTNRIVAIKVFSKRIDNGLVTVAFYPYGYNDEIAIFMGSGNNIKKTVLYPKYGKYAIIKNGEFDEEENRDLILSEDKGENF